MDQAVGAAQVDKGAKVAHAANPADASLARLQRFHQLAALLLFPFLLRFALGHDQPVAVTVDLNDLDADRFSTQARQTLLPPPLAHAGGHVAQMRNRHESTNAAVGNDDTPLVVANHLAFDDLAAGQQLLGLDPVMIQAGKMNGDDKRFRVLGLHDVDGELVIHLDGLTLIGFQLGQIGQRNDAVPLQTQIDDEALRCAGDHYARANVAQVG